MLGPAYAYGHLVTASFSLCMAVAFAVLAARVRAFRADFAYSLACALGTATGVAAMAVSLSPTLVRARLLFAVAMLLYGWMPAAWHLQFGGVLGERARRRHRAWVIAYAGLALVVAIVLLAGALDRGELRRVSVAGMSSGLPALRPAQAIVLLLLALANVPLSWALLRAEGPARRERWSCVPLMLFAPPLCVHELLICTGVSPLVPLGGYFAGAASLQGALVLAERFRALVGGERLGPYRIEALIGSGGMADVFRATRRGGGALDEVVQRVALKRLKRDAAAEPELARTIVREARVLARLSHPHIVKLYDVGEDEGELYLALELVDGASLQALLAQARRDGATLGAPVACELGLQIGGALAYAHALTDEAGRPLGLVHRDVSPHNLLVDEGGHVKLGDFGIARSAQRTSSTTGAVKGKLPYLAPEQLRGEAYDARVDLYALGVVMFEAVTGALPYEGRSDPATLFEILRAQPAHLERLRTEAAALAPIVERLLDPDPARRFADGGELVAALAPLRDEPAARARVRQLVADARAAEPLATARTPATRRLRRAR